MERNSPAPPRRHRGPRWWIAILLVGASALRAATPATALESIEPPVEAIIREDTTLELELAREADDWLTYAIVVAPEVESVEIALEGQGGDLDLYARWGAQLENYHDADQVADSPLAQETLRLSRGGAPRLRTGVYYLDVARLEGLARRAQLRVRFERGYQAPADEPAYAKPEPPENPDHACRVRRDSLFTLPFLDEESNFATIEIEVPSRTRRVLIEARGARGDVDLFAKRKTPLVDWSEDPEFSAATIGWDEQLVLASGNRTLKSGTYFVDVVNCNSIPRLGPVELRVVYDPETIEPLPASHQPVTELVPGERRAGSIDRSRTLGTPYRFLVPRGTRRIDLVVDKSERDIDLFLRHGQPVTSYEIEQAGVAFDYSRISARLNETLTVEAEGRDALPAGWWYLDVASLTAADLRVDYELSVTFDAEETNSTIDWERWLPDPDEAHWTPLERALLATVEISCENGGGSGTCIDPRGWIVTNYHLFTGVDAFQTGEIFISLTNDFRAEPRQLFTAEVIEADADLDLALLRITGDIYGHPLPAGLRLPFLPPAETDTLKLGDPLYVAGFPTVGGEEDRSSLSLTRGILTGFAREPGGRLGWLKTDAMINSGNSGGTLLTAKGLAFVGIPSLEIVLDEDELGYCRPVDLIPAAWHRHLEAGE